MDDTITGIILEKSDNLFDASLKEEGKKSYAKAFLSGALKGAVDSCFVLGVYYTIKNFVNWVRS